MLSGYNLIYLGPERWTGLWRNRHWLMSCFAQQNQVLYVEPARALRRSMAEWRSGRVEPAPWRWRPLSNPAPNLHIYHAPALAPVTGLPVLRQVTDHLRRRWLRRAAGQLGLTHPIVWIARPSVADLAEVFAARLTIYHVVDEYSAYPGTSAAKAARLRAAERPVLEAADLVIVTSRALLEAKRPGNPRTFWVPNAVNVAGYEQHLARGAPVPPDLAAIPRPRLGYVGLIGSKLDFALLAAVAQARPDWSLVFVGTPADSAQSGWDRLRALPNVYHVAAVPVGRVPEYVCGFDVGLMPYADSEHAQSIDPLKLYDYLAGGKPVVSTDLPALDGYRHVVRVANTPAEFVVAAEAALRDITLEQTTERRRLAEANSWDQRVEALSTLIETHLGEPNAASSRRRKVEPRRAEPVA